MLRQINFTNHLANPGGAPGATTLHTPAAVAVADRTGNLYVSEFGNKRILEYTAPITSSMAASRVFGHGGSFLTAMANKGGISASSLDGLGGPAVDEGGYLYMADSLNNRVLIFNPVGDTTAGRVLGQGTHFNTNAANNGNVMVNDSGLDDPFAVAIEASHDPQGDGTTLAVADTHNNRVLLFSPFTAIAAETVYGQAGSFTTGSNNNGGPSADSLSDPRGVAWINALASAGGDGPRRVGHPLAPRAGVELEARQAGVLGGQDEVAGGDAGAAVDGGAGGAVCAG